MLTIIGVIYGIDVISYFDIVRVVVDDERATFIVALFDPAVAVIVTVGAGKVVVGAVVATGGAGIATGGAGKVGVTDDDSVKTEDVPSAYFTTTLNLYEVPLVKPDIVVVLSDAPIVFVGGLDGGLDVTK